ncbi:hypothetical protein CHS0354_005702, partial [Potamilus streckersoni]
MEYFRDPIYDNGPPGISPYPARPYPGYAYPAVEYDLRHQASGVDISEFQERPGFQYEEENDEF